MLSIAVDRSPIVELRTPDRHASRSYQTARGHPAAARRHRRLFLRLSPVPHRACASSGSSSERLRPARCSAPRDTVPMLAAALVGGLVGAVVLTAAYFVGVALVGAGLGAAAANLRLAASGGEPGLVMVVLFSIVGAVASMYLQRYFIIVGTAIRRGVDADRGGDGACRGSRRGGGRRGRGHLGRLSARSGAWPPLGGCGLDRARAGRGGRTARLDRQGTKGGLSDVSEE